MRKLYLLLIIFFALLCADAGAQAKQEQPKLGDINESGTFIRVHPIGTTLVSVPSETVKEGEDCSCTMENLQKALRLATKDLKDPNERPPDWTSGTLILSESHPMTVDVRTPSEKLHDEAERLEEKSRIVRWILSVRDACKGEKISLDISKSEVLTLTDAHAASHSGSSGLLIVGSNGVMTIKHSDEFKKPAKPKRRKK